MNNDLKQLVGEALNAIADSRREAVLLTFERAVPPDFGIAATCGEQRARGLLVIAAAAVSPALNAVLKDALEDVKWWDDPKNLEQQ